ncbi:MAG: Ca-activated chloride channel [Blastocatellia bacterium]|jgi:Ca-activated chloride channel family protein|nr:Ca-activated chloride channel [Blastocatellia bacterium]
MHRTILSRSTSLFAIVAVVIALTWIAAFRRTPVVAAAASAETQGALQIVDSSGKLQGLCPLKHTDVKAEISGFLTRVTVTQEFSNPFKEKIEAVYTFPLPQNAAVDDMTMLVGDRTVRGRILRREQAQAVYEAAKTNGQVASLLDQERANIFTQSVANIMPGEQIKITLSYVETLKYEDGSYEFVFPMVVGPRYVPGSVAPDNGNGNGKGNGNGFASDTDRVPDASRITPRPAPEGMRAGHDISIDVSLNAGVPIDAIASKSHEVEVDRPLGQRAHVQLKDLSTIPNKDFILKYDVAGRKIEDAILTNRTDRGGFFTMILQPPDRIAPADVTPKELIFVLDTSGSMSGFPIEKAKESMKLAMDGLYPHDTFNLITFAGDTQVLFDQPVPATKENLQKAQQFLETRQGGGGTEMMKAIKAALDPSDAQGHVRIVCFMTDGYVGNDMEIIAEVQKHPNARVFGFGIGSSVNRFLLDKMAEEGRGEVEYVALNDDGSAAAKRFHERVRNPLLTDVTVDWNGLPVTDVYPQRIPDLFSAKPVILSGRYTAGGKGVIRLKGKMGGQDFVREIAVDLPESQPANDVLATLWARTRIDDLMSEDYQGAQRGTMKGDVQETITQLGLDYRLMTQFTSFVAVEEMIVTDGGKPRRIDVPIEMPEGVSRAGVFGDVRTEQFSSFPTQRTVTSLYSVGQTVNVTSRAAAINPSAPPPKVQRARLPVNGRNAGGSGSGVAGNAMVIDADEAMPVVSPEEQKRHDALMKFHPAILAVIDRLKEKNTKPGVDENKFIHDGKAEIQIWLTDKSVENLAKLKALGFEVVLDPKTSKMVIGRLSIDKLGALSELTFIRYVSPQMAGM